MSHRHAGTARTILATLATSAFLLVALPASQAQSPATPAGSGTSTDPYQISELGHLVWMGENAASSYGKHYVLTADIDASATAGWNDKGTDTSTLEGFKPIGPFTGQFDGQGHAITGLVINRPSTTSVGLFGYVGQGGQVRNLSMVGGMVTGGDSVGGLVGYSLYGTVWECDATVAVTGTLDHIGGLVGYSEGGSISNCHAAGAVMGNGDVGGLVGYSSGDLASCYATGPVTGSGNHVGGLVGDNYYGHAANCYASGAVAGTSDVGGLVGHNYCGTVSNCYAGGVVTGTGNYAGGLVGYDFYGWVSSSYWDVQSSGLGTSAIGTGKTTAEMKQQASFLGWNFAAVWGIREDATYPYLKTPCDYGDFNRDGFVDQQDLKIFTACATGPAVSYDQGMPTGCTLLVADGHLPTDLDHDGDVDQVDFAIFQRCWSGTLPADPTCAN